jgi:hypothetical protein
VPLPPGLHKAAVSPHILYLHGFASSGRSSKAVFLAEKLRASGLTLHAPDLNEPDFGTITVTRMLERTGREIDALPPGPVVLIGSSLGGLVAVRAALQRPQRVERLVLLAPALDFSGDRVGDLGDVDEWRRTNRLDVFHYGYGRVVPVHYELYEDLRHYDVVNASIAIPIQLFQGGRDTSCDPETAQRWASARPNVELHLLDDDHQLHGSLDYIWVEMRRFLQL